MDALPPRSDARDGRDAPVTTAVDPARDDRAPHLPAAPRDGEASGAPPIGGVPAGAVAFEPTTTPSQLRRFIKSRPWVPMHELRRRFGIEGGDDDMTGVEFEGGRIFLGLPPREASMLGDLIRQGEVGFELVHDPDCPAVAGVFPMRPVARP
jgi:hypothetical protein